MPSSSSTFTQPGSQYKILKVIGKGAFGQAYLGMHLKEQKQYVIKQIDIKGKPQQQKQTIFHQIRLLEQFNHINIVQFKDSFIDKKGMMNIVMEYCEGGDMNQIVQGSQTKIPQDKLVYWLAQIALAIFYMHDRKILHRDLKTPNIFIMKGDVRLGDFGISKVLDHVRDLAKTNIGTPYYMSPEQYNHKPYSYKSDIWGFGCILYEMCNQRRPFQANNIQALGMKVVRGNYPPVSQCYSKQLRELISEMLSKNPAKRPNIIEILQKPFVKRKVVDFMKVSYLKKDQISKESFNSLVEQANKLSITLDQKPNMSSKKPRKNSDQELLKQTPSKQRSRSSSKKKETIPVLSYHEKLKQQKLQRERKKQELQKQLNKQSQQRKQMAIKLKRIQEEKKNLIMAKKNSQQRQPSSLRSIYQKVKGQSLQKQANNSKTPPEVKQNNLVGNIIKEKGQKIPSQPSTQRTAKTSKDEQNSNNVFSAVKNNNDSNFNPKAKQIKVEDYSQTEEQHPKNIQSYKYPKAEDNINVINLSSNKFDSNPNKRSFQIQEDYEMEFEDCQPDQEIGEEDQQDDEQYYGDQEFANEQSNQSNGDGSGKGSNPSQKQFAFQDRNIQTPSFANDNKLCYQEVREMRGLVQGVNQVVTDLNNKGKSKEESSESANKQSAPEKSDANLVLQTPVKSQNDAVVKSQTKEQKVPASTSTANKVSSNKESFKKKENSTVPAQAKANVKNQIKAQPKPRAQSPLVQQDLLERTQTLKQQITKKNSYINSIRNELSNIDFQLSTDSDGVQDDKNSKGQPSVKAHFRRQFNPQHAKINDRINQLKNSAQNILGTKQYDQFEEYLNAMSQSGKAISRSFVQATLKDKIGVYHIMEQIIRLKKVIAKVQKYLD